MVFWIPIALPNDMLGDKFIDDGGHLAWKRGRGDVGEQMT
jgi:hypothetical protein